MIFYTITKIQIINLLIGLWILRNSKNRFDYKCFSCGASLDIEDCIFNYVCDYCGVSVIDKENYFNERGFC